MSDFSFDDKIKSITCKELKATYCIANGFLGGPQKCSFQHNGLSVTINQIGKRVICIKSQNDVTVESLIQAYQNIEKLLMLFDGRFISLETVEFNEQEDLSKQYSDRRLNYYQSSDFTQYPNNKFLDFDSIITEDIYKKWVELLDEADIMHQIFLYSLAKGGFTNDVKLAFLVETAEPMVELVKDNTIYFTTLNPGQHGTTLKMCIDNLITTYGQEIFDKELQRDYAEFLQKSVDSRIRVMHIKKKFAKKHFDSKENILYLIKYSFLYRRILLELLGISYTNYSENLKSQISKWENWCTQIP